MIVPPRLRLATALALSAFCLGACQSQSSGQTAAEAPQRGPLTEPDKPTESPRLHPVLLLDQLAPGSLGPHLAPTSAGWVTVAVSEEAGDRRFRSTFLPDSVFEPAVEAPAVGPAKQLGLAPSGLRRFSLHPNRSGGLAVLHIHASAEGDLLSVLGLGPSGQLLSERTVLASSPVPIVWETLLPARSAAEPQLEGLCLFAERHQDTADLYGFSLLRSSATEARLIFRGALAWQAAHWAGQNLLALTRHHERGARIELLRLDARGQPIDEAQIVASGLDGAYELDLVPDGDRLRIVWTARDSGAPRLWSSTMDAMGTVGAPQPLTPPRLTQSLLRAISGQGASSSVGPAAPGDGDDGRVVPALAWTEPDLTEPASPPVLVAPIDALDRTLVVRHRGHDPLLPEFVRTGAQTWGLFEGRSCRSAEDCDRADLFALSATTEAAGVRALSTAIATVGGRDARAAQAWDLTCAGQPSTCLALVADAGSPASVFVVSLSDLEFGASPLAQFEARPVRAAQTLRPVVELASLAAWSPPGGGSIEGAWLSFFDPSEPYRKPPRPAPDGRRAPLRARLETFGFPQLSDAAGAEVGKGEGWVVSYRARSLGGLAFAPSPQGGGLLVWAAIDGQQPQLFATLLDDQGKKVRQRMLTRQRGEVLDVQAVTVDGGWVLAWVGGEAGNEEVHALRVDERLSVSKPVKVSQGAVNPTGLSLVPAADGLVAAWADARESSQAGRADLYVVELQGDGAPRSAPRKIVGGQSHFHSPQLAAIATDRGARVTLAYIEAREVGVNADATAGAGGVADLVARGRGQLRALPIDSPSDTVELGPASTAAFDWDCGSGRCRAVGASAADGSAELWTGTWILGEDPEAAPLAPLRTRAAEAALPRWAGETIVFADESDAGWVLRRIVPAPH